MASETPVAPESADGTAASTLAATERALVAAVLRKDRKAAGEFVLRYTDTVYAYVSRRLAPRRDLAEDVVQDVFLAAFQQLGTFAGRTSIVNWLLGIARHKVEDFYRALLRHPEPLKSSTLCRAMP